MAAFSWIFRQPVKGRFDVIPRILHPVAGRCMQGYVIVYSPLVPSSRLRRPSLLESQIQVLVPSKDLPFPARRNLVEIDFLYELIKAGEVFVRRGNLES